MELGELAAKHIATCKQLSDEQFGILSEAVLEAVVGIRALEQSTAAGIGSSSESEAGIALLLVEAAKGGISGGDLEVRKPDSREAPSAPRLTSHVHLTSLSRMYIIVKHLLIALVIPTFPPVSLFLLLMI